MGLGLGSGLGLGLGLDLGLGWGLGLGLGLGSGVGLGLELGFGFDFDFGFGFWFGFWGYRPSKPFARLQSRTNLRHRAITNFRSIQILLFLDHLFAILGVVLRLATSHSRDLTTGVSRS